MFHDRKYEASLAAAAEEISEESTGAGGEDFDLGGEDFDLGGEDFDLGGEEDPGDTEEAEELESPLLASPPAPAKRNDHGQQYSPKSLKSAARGKKYVKKEKRGGDGRNGRPQSYKSIAIPKPRELIPGMMDMMSLSRGIYENELPNYKNEENILLESNLAVRRVIMDLQQNSEIKLNEDET